MFFQDFFSLSFITNSFVFSFCLSFSVSITLVEIVTCLVSKGYPCVGTSCVICVCPVTLLGELDLMWTLGHIFPQDVLAAKNMVGGGAGDEGARARARARCEPTFSWVQWPSSLYLGQGKGKVSSVYLSSWCQTLGLGTQYVVTTPHSLGRISEPINTFNSSISPPGSACTNLITLFPSCLTLCGFHGLGCSSLPSGLQVVSSGNVPHVDLFSMCLPTPPSWSQPLISDLWCDCCKKITACWRLSS